MPHKKLNTGIYCIENLINKKKYVGQANNIERRLYEHKYHLLRGTDKSPHLQRAVSKYGMENFIFYIIENCSREEMSNREIYFIKLNKSNQKKYGYNLSSGGESGLVGYKHASEVGQKISSIKKAMNWKMSDEQKQKISKWHTGKVVSEETKLKMSKNHARYWLGKKMPQELIEKLRVVHGGQNAYQFGTKSKNASSQYFGVHRSIQKGHTYWIAQAKFQGGKTYLGMRKDELEAALLYDSHIKEHNLPNPLNFPEK